MNTGISMTRLFTAAAAAALAALIAAPAGAADAAAGAEKAKQVCAACHGADGAGVAQFPDYPKLAGQHRDYLLQALRQYKAGSRKNPIMGGMVQALSPKDMEDVALYFSEQKGSLYVKR